jgi:hypothetical protein
MSDAFDRLERQIVAALPSHVASAQRRPRRLRASRRRLLVVTLAALVGGSAVATAQLIDQGTVVKPRSENLDLAQTFAVFRRPATDQDVLRTRRGVPDPTIAGTTRLVLTDGARRLYANNAGDCR